MEAATSSLMVSHNLNLTLKEQKLADIGCCFAKFESKFQICCKHYLMKLHVYVDLLARNILLKFYSSKQEDNYKFSFQ